ncbi:F-box protein At3g07870-like [Magnolia sinica]|uniref:F-box protein At3g07870-like n=1 Tax=Magnolia sinica TaxID=86752 RepID=UPI002658E18F|nr:F-box protein At3g07870-like [Magnolia sinica]XP_058107327.1 F-box protein At3g07870-like [Magnolia sinica]
MARPAKINQRKYIKNKNSRRREVLWNSISLEKGKSLSDYPEEIISNILSRLPASSLNDLKRVCKNWLDIISSSCFIQCHLARVQPYLIERKTFWNNQIRSVDVKDSEIRVRNLVIGCDWEILATCNGLLLIKDYLLDDICISNPATKQLLRLPTCSKSPCDDYHLLHDLEYYVGFDYAELDFYRFGYAPSTREYKVVHFFHDGFHQLCEILTLGSDSWRRIDISFLVLPLIFSEQLSLNNGVLPLIFSDQLSLNGVLHWVVGYHYIMSMDVAQETFDETRIPSCIRPNYDTFYMDETFHLSDIRGSPSLINRISDVEFEVWILKDFQIKEWIKLRNIDGTARGLINLIPLPCLRNDEVVFQSREKKSGHLVLSTYDFKLQKMIQGMIH